MLDVWRDIFLEIFPIGVQKDKIWAELDNGETYEQSV